MRRYALLALIPTALIGCGDGLEKYPTAKVTGRLLCQGKPVANAVVLFAPMDMKTKADSGKPGEGITDAEGKFTLSTYGSRDGAVVGKHEVRINRPPASTDFKCDCEINPKLKVQEVQVAASGDNLVTIDLPLKAPPVAGPAGRKRSKDELADEKSSLEASNPK